MSPVVAWLISRRGCGKSKALSDWALDRTAKEATWAGPSSLKPGAPATASAFSSSPQGFRLVPQFCTDPPHTDTPHWGWAACGHGEYWTSRSSPHRVRAGEQGLEQGSPGAAGGGAAGRRQWSCGLCERLAPDLLSNCACRRFPRSLGDLTRRPREPLRQSESAQFVGGSPPRSPLHTCPGFTYEETEFGGLVRLRIANLVWTGHPPSARLLGEWREPRADQGGRSILGTQRAGSGGWF